MDSPRRRSTPPTDAPQVLETLLPQSFPSSGTSIRGARDTPSSPTENETGPCHSESLPKPKRHKGGKWFPVTIRPRFAFLPRHWLRLRRFWKDRLESSWAWEICGMSLSISCMVAITATLPYLSEHPLSDWQFLLAPNTMISTFITVMKTSMLLVVAEGMGQLKWTYFMADAHPIAELQRFDVASRGPWGSLTLLLHTDRKKVLASVGAIITIASLAIDPFGQQIITFETRYMPRNDTNAVIPVAYAYERPNFSDENFDWELRGAISAGFFNQSSPTPIVCPTGNCTWPAFSTLGLCTSCTDVAQQVTASNCTFYYSYYDGTNQEYFDQKQCAFPPTNEKPLPSDCLRWPKKDPLSVSIQTAFSIPDSGSFDFAFGAYGSPITSTTANVSEFAIGSGTESEEIITSGSSLPYISAGHPSSITEIVPISRYAYIAVTARKMDLNNTVEIGTCPRVSFQTVMDCRIRTCLKTFQPARMINGNMLLQSGKDIFLDLDLNATAEHGGSWEIYSEPSSSNDSNQPLTEPRKFRVDRGRADLIRSMTSNLFNAESNHDNSFFDLWIGDALYKGKDISRLMDDIADSITHLIRTGTNRTNIQGTAYYPEVFVVVRWQWCILPGALIVLSVVFFSLTIWTSRAQHGSQTPLWKSNLLPFLFYGLEGWTGEEMRVPEDGTAMKEAAQGMVARIEKNEEGDRRFVRVDALRSDESLDGFEGQTLAEEGIPLSTIESQSTR